MKARSTPPVIFLGLGSFPLVVAYLGSVLVAAAPG